ncbi:MAG TPA: cytochrome c biogenesis protein CcdA [Acidimicrobiales bacterium]|nr:cytochrome c biogenesis protein CcdA [Acidimicrobiales bacterium]
MIGTLPSSLIAAMPIAFAAGLVSFASPCVLPLVPGYLAFLSGATGSVQGRGRGRAVLGALAFIVGFGLVFVSFGALFGGLGKDLNHHERLLEVVAGVVTVALGLFFAGWWPSTWLSRDKRFHFLPRASVLGAGVLGFTFALGWSPCLGPTLAAVDVLAASSSNASALRGSILAFVYCLGLGVPFLVAALATEWMAVASTWLKAHARDVGRVGGVLLIAVGVAEFTGAWHAFVLWLQTHVPAGHTFI